MTPEGVAEEPLALDVLVIGGGFAGAIAALAARAAGRRVALARRSPGATALSSGAVGVAPDPSALPGDPFSSRRGPIESARRLAALRPEHPYARVERGLDRLAEALAFAAGELSDLLSPPAERARWIAGPYGAVSECALCQRTMDAGDLAAARGTVAVVGLRGHLGWDARLVAAGIERLVPLGAPRALVVELDFFVREALAVARPHELAAALEMPGAAEAAGALVRQRLPSGVSIALLPPILGRAPGRRVADRFAAAAGIPVAEMLSDIPSVPGLRLQAAIDARLAAAGVDILSGTASRAQGPGAPVRVNEREVTAAAWVLATGRFVGGGIIRRGRLEEPLLGLPVEAVEGGDGGIHLASRPAASITHRESHAPQPLLSAGLRVDPLLRPLGADGSPVHPALHAAGAVIGGHEAASDGTGLGVALLTGYLAGRAAAGEL